MENIDLWDAAILPLIGYFLFDHVQQKKKMGSIESTLERLVNDVAEMKSDFREFVLRRMAEE